MKSIVKVEKLEKSYKDKNVVQGISFEVMEGEILCFLGPNGAGKSTTINILSGVLGYESGKIMYQGNQIGRSNRRNYKKKLGVVPQDLALYDDLTARQNLSFFASLYGLKDKELEERCQEALVFVGLSDRADDIVKTFSGGMKRRLNIACSIAHKPILLIMDEPTVGIDPQSRNHILNTIKTLREQGMTILYTTHYMEEVEEISTRIIIMDHGKIIAEGTKEELKETMQEEKQFFIEVQDGKVLQIDEFYRLEGVKNVSLKDNELEISTCKGVDNLDRLISVIIQQTGKIKQISCQVASLETVFLRMTGRNLRD